MYNTSLEKKVSNDMNIGKCIQPPNSSNSCPRDVDSKPKEPLHLLEESSTLDDSPININSIKQLAQVVFISYVSPKRSRVTSHASKELKTLKIRSSFCRVLIRNNLDDVLIHSASNPNSLSYRFGLRLAILQETSLLVPEDLGEDTNWWLEESSRHRMEWWSQKTLLLGRKVLLLTGHCASSKSLCLKGVVN
ncbi:hypothetical protein Tco_0465764 [Tanacetum coccineum]